MKRIQSLAYLALVVLLVFILSGCASKKDAESGEVARPSNAGGPGEAVNLKGDPVKGEQIFQANCVVCHGEKGKGGVANAGSADKTVPELEPLDPSMVSADAKTFATNIDLFIEHGSTPEAEEGSTPGKQMPAFGDQKVLQPQEIADVIAYVMSLNK